MIHHSLLSHIRNERRFEDFLYPFYESLSIAEIVPTILQSYKVPTQRKGLTPVIANHPALAAKRKILFLTDGFGYNHFIKYYKRFPLLKALAHTGDIYPITSVFPSTTSAALTTFHTGLTPQEHGLPEWNVYFEEFDSIIQTLPFKTWAMTETDGLLKEGGNASMLYQGPTAYSELAEHDIASYVFIKQDYVDTVYSQSTHRGSTIVPFSDGTDMLHKLVETLKVAPEQAYFMVYWADIDSTAHKYGPDTPEHEGAIARFDRLMREEFFSKLTPELRRDTALLLSADHGHVNIKDEDILKLNDFPEIEESYLKGKGGKKILPTGSPHDVFLYIQPEKKEVVMKLLKEELVGQAEVMTTEEALQRGLFGINHPSEKFLRRIGNVLILPNSGYHVWYNFFNSPFDMLGIHGGLTEQEMLVPLAITSLDSLHF